MSKYDNYKKDELAYEIDSFLDEHSISELLTIIADSIEDREYLNKIEECNNKES